MTQRRSQKARIALISCCLALAAVGITASVGPVRAFLVTRFRGGEPAAAMADRNRRLIEILLVLRDYRDGTGEWPESDDALRTAGIDVTALLRPPRGTSEPYRILYQRLHDPDGDPIIVEDPGYTYDVFTAAQMAKFRVSLRRSGELVEGPDALTEGE